EKARQLQDDLTCLNSRIKREDEVFWNRVDKGLSEGAKFSIEEIASNFSLDTYDKRVLILFLYLGSCRLDPCSKHEVVELLDCDDSSVERIRRLRHFSKQAPLYGHGFLGKEFKEDGTSSVAYFLAETGLDMVTKLLDGEEIPQEAEEKAEADSTSRVGYVKVPDCSLDQVVLKDQAREKVLFFLDAFREKKLEPGKTGGKGLTFLFYGLPGTGKSLTAEAIAFYLGKKILMVESSKIMSRWVGGTDRNISDIFKSASESDTVICIDEADSLLYNRNYAVQEHDIRFVNVMLQELERFKGVAVLTTNMDVLLDPALERRATLRVRFELPDEMMRCQIWKTLIPKKVRVAEDVDFSVLAKRYTFAGGYIRNAIDNALRRVRDKDLVTMDDLVFGAELEVSGMMNKQKPKMGFTTQ
ncbi:MAG: ATP-binding protein, partial [Candidatus Zixiibacteriota bacterium]